MEHADVIVIGGGIVGLATAVRLQQRSPGRHVVVVEKERKVGAHQTGHNSGVIHSGIYYKPGSLKAQTCVAGARQMVEFCREYGVPCKVVGKVVVATSDDQIPALEELNRRGLENGVPGLRILNAAELHAIEPHAAGVAALHVPGTAITDYSLVAAKMADLVRANGGEIHTRTEVRGVRRNGEDTVIETTSGGFCGPKVINCAGLFSDRICRMAGAQPGVRIVPFRGEYYIVPAEKHAMIRGLIYPVPDPKFPFLGVHLTPTVHGGVEAGPNAVLALKREGYRKTSFSLRDAMGIFLYPGFWKLAAKHWRSGLGEMARSFSKEKFVRELKNLVPDLESADLQPGGAGVRAQAVDASGALVDDFRIVRQGGMVHVLNVPSPAATASLAIGEKVAELVESNEGSTNVDR